MKRCVSSGVHNFTATIGITAPSTCRSKMVVCLLDVRLPDGQFREHCWVERIAGVPKKGTKIKFRSRVRKYFSHFEGLVQVNKIGLSGLKQVERIVA